MRKHHQHIIDKQRAAQSIYKKKPESNKRKRRRLQYQKIAVAEENCKEGYD
jgi:hypothetical protein